MIDESKFKTKEELFQFLVKNKDLLFAQKKSETKKSDAFSFVGKSGDEIIKSVSVSELLEKESIEVKAVINTTGLLDSHSDVHIPGLWKKTIKEQKLLYHLQEHKMDFAHVISDNVKASVQNYTWKDLGYDFEGETEALIFDSNIEKSRNQFMFEQYAKGYVKNHSVGMKYVQIFLCVNSNEKDFASEKQNWDKYFQYVVNKEETEKKGYFFAVTEAKLVEGSAVLAGSNWATPTLDIKNIEPSDDTQTEIEPQESTQKSLLEKIGKSLN